MFEGIKAKLQVPRREDVLESMLELALEIAREGREGRRIGTMFTVGDGDAVLELSRPLILDPVACHPESLRSIFDPNVRGTLKELVQLDGAFIISGEGILLAGCRYLEASSAGIDIPLGLGTRHRAAAGITRATTALGVVVSESAIVRVFERGALVAEIFPEIWLMRRHTSQLRHPVHAETVQDMAVVTPEDPKSL